MKPCLAGLSSAAAFFTWKATSLGFSKASHKAVRAFWRTKARSKLRTQGAQQVILVERTRHRLKIQKSFLSPSPDRTAGREEKEVMQRRVGNKLPFAKLATISFLFFQ